MPFPPTDPLRPIPSPIASWFARLFSTPDDPHVAGELRLEREFLLAMSGIVLFTIARIVQLNEALSVVWPPEERREVTLIPENPG